MSEIADQVVVLELGKQIETGPANAVLQHPKELYTQKLINAVPELKPRRRPPVDGNPTLLEAKNVVKTYTLGGFFTGRVKVRALRASRPVFAAVKPSALSASRARANRLLPAQLLV